MWKKKKLPKKHVATIRINDDEQAAVTQLMQSEKVCKQEAVRRVLKGGGDEDRA